MSITAAALGAPGNPTGEAGLPPAAPAGALPPGAAAPADDEVLPVAELLRLLEQGSGFAQALAGAVTAGDATAAGSNGDALGAADAPGGTGASCSADPGAAAAASPAPQDGAAPGAEEEAPCDIATLLRILESQPSPPPAAAAGAASSAPAGGARSRPANGARAADETLVTDAAAAGAALAGALIAAATPDAAAAAQQAAIGAQEVASDAAAPSGARPQAAPRASMPAAATAASAAVPEPAAAMPRTDVAAGAAVNAAIAGELRAQHIAREPTIVSASDEAAGREAATRAADAKPAPADPAAATLALAQSLRSEPPAAAPVERTVQVPVRDPAWPQAVAAEIHFLADRKVEAATLRLSPEHLGPVEVRIDVRDGNVSVSFGVAHGDTQAALEQALPRLREMLAAAGLHLGQASVQQEARRGSHNGGAATAAGEPAGDAGDAARAPGARAVGLVDEYV